jgi:hypothetical protein
MAKETTAQIVERAAAAVAPLGAELDLASRLEPFADRCWDGSELHWPVLHLDDFSGIPFLIGITGVEEYQHRARIRAAGGDLYVAASARSDVYEAYCENRLRLAPVEFVQVELSQERPTLARACGAGTAWKRLVQQARAAGGLALHPYMGIETVWDLGRSLSREAEVPVTLVAPPPPTTWIANDKQLFDRLVELVLGREWLVETFAAQDPGTLTGLLLDLAQRHERVGLKRLRCASAMGNAVFDSESLQMRDPQTVEKEVVAFLDRTEWDGREEVQAVAWEGADHSPSTQLWIPPLGGPPPHVDGIYEQLLEGERKVFVGSRPSTLPERVNQALASASLAVAAGLQALGYAGRCSFDFLLVGDPKADFELHFTECNGRWGGTSIPMTLVDRVLGGSSRPPYRAQDFVHPGLVGASIEEVLERVGDEAYDVGTGQGRFLFYNIGPLAQFGKLDVVAMGATQEEAEAALEEDLPRILGLES